MPFFRRFYKHFLKFLLFPLILSLLIYVFTTSPIIAGFSLGTLASILMLWNWYYNLERSYDEENGKISTGTAMRFLTVVVTCLFWAKFPEIFNIFGIAAGISQCYIMIMYRGIKELTK